MEESGTLKPANVDILTTLHVWGKNDFDQNRKSMVREAANNKFCEDMIDAFTNLLVLVPGTYELFEEEDEYENDDES